MSGDLQRDKAFNKMAKLLEKSRGNSEKPETLLEQMKRVWGESWQHELDEMRLERAHPTFQADKAAAVSSISRDYDLAIPRWDRSPEHRARWMRSRLYQWREDYAAKMGF
jgi:hypothetical protein